MFGAVDVFNDVATTTSLFSCSARWAIRGMTSGHKKRDQVGKRFSIDVQGKRTMR